MNSESVSDELFLALADEHRRRLLFALLEHDPDSSPGLRVPAPVYNGGRERERLRIQLYHTHLPMLDQAGFIRWDGETHVVERGQRFEEIRPYLDWIVDRADADGIGPTVPDEA